MSHTWTNAEQHGWTVCVDCGAIQEFPHSACDEKRKQERVLAQAALRTESAFDRH
jgi:Fe2+ or Zn2+ uptake regulation protein